ncbi:MAG: hypothetical protein ABSE93_19650 [Terriglobia bacterium]|jgi:hypothetical protein
MQKRDCVSHLLLTVAALLGDTLTFIGLGLRSRSALMAENLFLRKQLTLYLEREVKPRRASDATRLTLVLLSQLFPWRKALASFKPRTFLRWHRQGNCLFWQWKSRPRGRPRIPRDLQRLIAAMARNNPT